jgi:anti-sigma factor ChrR (cupin superfamily)
MSDQMAAHQMTDLAALHALGALSQHEARAFERHLAEGCAMCAAEFESFERTVGDLALSIPEVEPPHDVRDQLLLRVTELSSGNAEPRHPSPDQFVSIHAMQGEWQEVQAGVLLKTLYVDQTSRIATSLVRMMAGTALPAHYHLGVEQFFVIEGDCNVAGQKLGPGDYHRAASGSIHDTTYTVDGTLFLLIAPEHYEVLDAR